MTDLAPTKLYFESYQLFLFCYFYRYFENLYIGWGQKKLEVVFWDCTTRNDSYWISKWTGNNRSRRSNVALQNRNLKLNRRWRRWWYCRRWWWRGCTVWLNIVFICTWNVCNASTRREQGLLICLHRFKIRNRCNKNYVYKFSAWDNMHFVWIISE
jgi:hypothetical protein